jgi:hypothetical protein
MNISSRVSEDGPNDSFAIATFSGIFGIISAGAVVMGAVTEVGVMAVDLAETKKFLA